jgi:hypothetical protein
LAAGEVDVTGPVDLHEAAVKLRRRPARSSAKRLAIGQPRPRRYSRTARTAVSRSASTHSGTTRTTNAPCSVQTCRFRLKFPPRSRTNGPSVSAYCWRTNSNHSAVPAARPPLTASSLRSDRRHMDASCSFHSRLNTVRPRVCPASSRSSAVVTRYPPSSARPAPSPGDALPWQRHHLA